MRYVKNILMLVIAGALFGVSYALLTQKPCGEPLTYRIGEFDAKFGVSKQEFLADIAAAEAVWEKAYAEEGGKGTLFRYDENGSLPVNLIYDSRQATVDKNKVLSDKVDDTVASANTIKAQFDELKSEYESDKREYASLSAQYESDLAAYNREVSGWNVRGGAPRAEYDRMEQEKAALESLRTAVNAKADDLNSRGAQINALIDRYNWLVDSANSVVDKINQSAEKEFEEGDYVSDDKGQRINVYEFDGKTRLVRLLAHELGHALGMDHTQGPESIMYYLNKSTSLVPSADDLAALKAVCQIK
ncbi:MAG TPA: matrixin family metalloprotease [Candidatus Paceibacterota bacterium]|nr:matrixin family metalloprotease [Candidatus Paceibacterota bacterium]